MATRLTVFIPCYNSEAYLDSCIKSVLVQSYDNYKIVIVDDHSTDRSVAIAEQYLSDRVSLIVNRTNLGITANWNRCIELCDTPYFSILHSDDMYMKGYLENMMQIMEKYQDIAYAHCSVKIINEKSKTKFEFLHLLKRIFSRNIRGISEPYDLLKVLLKGNFIYCPTAVYRTSAVRDIGLFDESYSHVEDLEYWFRFILKDYKSFYLDKPLYFYRRHKSNLTAIHSKDLTRYRERYDLLNKILKDIPEHYRDMALKYLDKAFMYDIMCDIARCCFSRAIYKLKHGSHYIYGRTLSGRIVKQFFCGNS